jgi:O-antigen ligase
MGIVALALLMPLLALTAYLGPRRMLLAVILVRPSCDRAFELVKAGLDQSSGPGAAINALVILLAVLAAVHVPLVILSPVIAAWLTFLAAAVASALHGPDPAAGVRLLLALCSYLAVLVLASLVVRFRRDVELGLKAALASSLVPVAYAILEMATGMIQFNDDGRLQGTFTHPNIFAFFIVGVVTLILFLRCTTLVTLSSPLQHFLFAYMVLLLLLLLITQTRSAWIAMALILMGYALIVDRRGLLLVLLLPLVLLVPGVSERVLDLTSGNVEGGYAQLNSYAWRQLLWRDTLEWMSANPSVVFGYGLDLYKSYTPLFFPKGTEGVGAHNAFLQIYFEMGLFGLGSFVLIFVCLISQLAARMRHDFAGSAILILWCVGYLLCCYSDNMLDYLQFQWFFWFCIGTVCAAPVAQRPAAAGLPRSGAPTTEQRLRRAD